ncbi:MAG: 4Fe-4S cluster-binding domain-containing protein [Thermoplasmatales archaeon]|nr:MAG: 4Fe-4S cluster-binding domain-containing protein [Thermoplasmatales archaeon]
MSNFRSILPNYYSILEENGIAQYIQCKNSPVSFDINESTEILWKKHDKSLKKIKVSEIEPETSLLDLKIELANRIFQNCFFCERKCNVDRTKTSGNCGVKEARISSEFLHFGEENVLVPSYTIFFSGCTFHCVFCQNWNISQHIGGLYVESDMLANAISRRKNDRARNVNWVGGDPTSNLKYILKVLKKCKENIPQVWNSNMYCSEETMKLLNGIIDVYLTDFKYGNDDCAKRLSKVDNYTKVIKRNHKTAYNQGEMIIRHLVLPNHVKCCSEPILQWINKNTPEAAVNVMAQYRPEYHAYEYEDMARPLSTEEYLQAKNYAKKLNIHIM